jgi:hypothetical protein
MKTLKKLSSVALVFLLLMSAASCKKKEKEPEIPEALEKLTDRPWSLDKVESYDANDVLTNTTNYQNFSVKFYKDGVMEFDDNGNTWVEAYALREGNPNKLLIGNDWFILIVFEDDEMVLKEDSQGNDYIKIYFSR